ncbi:MAG: hypothetical protein C5B49_15935 [Bdellovibrio sp.]|nr:MAG: hypothetical protein C5B49_15935 [Bdellovibrio sp.]
MSRTIPPSLARRLTFFSTISIVTLLMMAVGLVYFELSREFTSLDKGLLTSRMNTISILLSQTENQYFALRQRVEKEWYELNHEHILVRVLDPQGRVLSQTPHLDLEHSEILAQLQDLRDSPTDLPRRMETESGRVYQVRAFSVRTAQVPTAPTWISATGSDRVEIALETTNEEAFLRSLRRLLVVMVIVSAFASLWIGPLVARLALKPARNFSTFVQRISSEHLEERLDPHQMPAEFGPLANTLNHMLDRLSGSFQRMATFSEGMAHEIRTPVNNLLGSMTVALSRERTPAGYRATLASGVEECERLKRIVDSLLFIARASDPREAVRKQELGALTELQQIVSFYEVSAEEAGIELHLETSAQTKILADRTLLQRSIGNLISNSIRHSRAGGKIFIRAQQETNSVRIEVSDQGSGIPPEALPHLGERFFRVDHSRNKSQGGAGLGLLIVKSIVQIHGGEFKVESELERGTTIVLNFPS